ncbi:MAG: hypothetical protein ACLRTQ_10670 [Candidatus Borkfalkia sp.]
MVRMSATTHIHHFSGALTRVPKGKFIELMVRIRCHAPHPGIPIFLVILLAVFT